MRLENLHRKPLKGYASSENGLFITKSDIERAKAEIAENGPLPIHEQRPTPIDKNAPSKPPSQYIHT